MQFFFPLDHGRKSSSKQRLDATLGHSPLNTLAHVLDGARLAVQAVGGVDLQVDLLLLILQPFVHLGRAEAALRPVVLVVVLLLHPLEFLLGDVQVDGLVFLVVSARLDQIAQQVKRELPVRLEAKQPPDFIQKWGEGHLTQWGVNFEVKKIGLDLPPRWGEAGY